MAQQDNAWNVSEKDYPKSGSVSEQLAFCVRYAILAPSTYNTQPWNFVIRDNVVSLYADRRHALPVLDPDDREMNISCGAALYALRLAIRYFGHDATTEILPDPNDENLLARVRMGEKCDPLDDQEKILFNVITKRHTNRGVFSDKEIPEEVIHRLQSAASREGTWLHICTPAERKMIMRMIVEGDHIQSADKHFRREIAAWIDPRRVLDGDGMPNLGLNYSDVIHNLKPSVIRRFEVDSNKSANDQQLEDGAPCLAILGGTKGGILHRINVGQACMRVFLRAEAEGLAVSPLNQPCEVPHLRLMLHDEIPQQGRAQMILRIGYGGKPSYTPRRPLHEVIDMNGEKADQVEKSAANHGSSGFVGKLRGFLRK